MHLTPHEHANSTLHHNASRRGTYVYTTQFMHTGTGEFKKKSWALAAAKYGDAVTYIEDMLEGPEAEEVRVRMWVCVYGCGSVCVCA